MITDMLMRAPKLLTHCISCFLSRKAQRLCSGEPRHEQEVSQLSDCVNRRNCAQLLAVHLNMSDGNATKVKMLHGLGKGFLTGAINEETKFEGNDIVTSFPRRFPR